MLAQALALQLLLAQAGSPALRVHGVEEVAPPCPRAFALVEAIRTRSRGVALSTGGAPQGDDLAVSIAVEPGAWRLYVHRPSGEVALSRTIDTAGRGCQEVADTAALILDRFLVHIDWRGRPALLDVLPEPERPKEPPSPELPPPEPLRLGVSLGGSARFGLPSSFSPGASIDVSGRLGRLRASLWLFGAPASRQTVTVGGHDRGTFTTQSFAGGATLAWCRSVGPLEACGGGLLGAELTLADAQGPHLYRRSPQAVWLPSAGGYGRLAYPLPWRLEVATDLALAAPLGSVRLEVEDTGVGYSPPALGAALSLRLGWRFF